MERSSNPGGPLRVLLVEDSEADAELVVRVLQRAGYQLTVKRVETKDGFKRELELADWDIIISDHHLPGYSGLSALADLQATGRDIPFILISGTVGESVAVMAMKAGAQDYVLKGDLTRLAVAVGREVKDATSRAEQNRMREQLVISERMASAGTLAAGLAHEINNPLALAMSNVDFAIEVLDGIAAPAGADDVGAFKEQLAEMDEPLRDTREALERIRDIVRDVKLFSRPDDEATGAVDVRRILDSSSRMAWNEIRHRARLVKDYGKAPLVMANESRLGQVVLNLIVNAAQAIAEGQAEDNEIRLVARTGSDGHAIIEVRDTGAGIPAENLGRLFDPFFTTKPVGEGTGLGLAICHRTVTELGGTIEVVSEVGQGSTFRVSLPAAMPGADRPPRPASIRPPAPHRARVLVVDDEPALARALGRVLSVQHDVVALTSAKEALARIEAGERFDVILSDLMMPDVTGVELHEQLQRVAPDQAERMAFFTGGAFTATARAFLASVPNPRIDKPCEPAKLLALIAEMTGAADPESQRGAG